MGVAAGGISATSNFSIIDKGGLINIWDDGITNIPQVNDGGILHAYTGSFVNNLHINTGGLAIIDDPTGLKDVFLDGGTLKITGYVRAANQPNVSGVINFGNNGGTIILPSGSGGTTASLKDIANGGKIDLQGLAYDPQWRIKGVLGFQDFGGVKKIIGVDVSGAYDFAVTGNSNAQLALSSDGNGGTWLEFTKAAAVVGSAATNPLDSGHLLLA